MRYSKARRKKVGDKPKVDPAFNRATEFLRKDARAGATEGEFREYEASRERVRELLRRSNEPILSNRTRIQR